jgi:hypothetical protein
VWEQILSEAENAAKIDRPSIGVLSIERRIDGGLKNGLFAGRLLTRFEVLDQLLHDTT